MNPLYILDTLQLAMGVHSSFNCIDCHSMDYETYPHNGELKLEPMMTCIDCHGGDETYASWKFDEIEEEFHKSVHYEIYGDQFSCSKCHSQHYYRPVATVSSSLQEIVQAIMPCAFRATITWQGISWFPIQLICRWFKFMTGCPTRNFISDVCDALNAIPRYRIRLLVSHNIMRKEHATRNCVECHSANSACCRPLYKYQNLQHETDQKGFLAVLSGGDTNLSNEYYVIGASRIPFLNLIYAIFSLQLLGGNCYSYNL
jgi:hypothetical protein